MRTVRHVMAAGVVACAVAAGAARGSVVVSYHAAPPIQGVALSQPVSHGATIEWEHMSSRRDVGQTFRPGAGFALHAVTVQAGGMGGGAPGAPFALSIYRVPSQLDLSPPQLVADRTGTMPTDPFPGLNTYVRFDLTPVALEEDVQYGFLLAFPDAAASRLVTLLTSYPDEPYAGGTYFESAEGGPFTPGTDDLVFYLQDGTPEPATAGLVGCGLGAILLARRRLYRQRNRRR